MIYSDDASVFVSTNKFEYKKLNVKELSEKWQKCFAISMHTGFKQFDVTPINGVKTEEIETEMMTIVVRNNLGIEHRLTAMPYQKIFTRNIGYIPMAKLTNIDILIDDENRLCKLVKKEFLAKSKYQVFSAEIAYNSNFLCNGILVRGL